MKIGDRFYGWPLLGFLVCILVSTMGFPVFGSSVINAVMAQEMHLSRSVMGLGFTMVVISGGVPAPLVAWVIGKIGARLTIVIGSLTTALGSLLMGVLVTTGWQYVLVFGVIVGTGICFSAAIPAQTVITHWFSRKRALALSILWLGTGGGGAIAAPVMGYLIGAASGNWRVGWYLMSGMTLAAALVAFLFVKNTPSEVGQLPDGDASNAAPETAALALASKPHKTYHTDEVWTVHAALRTLAFWRIVGGSTVFMLPLMVMFAHLILHLRDLGHTPAIAALSIGFIGVGQVAGKLTAGVFGDRVEPRFLWFFALVMMAVGIMLAIDARSQSDIYVFAFLLGAGQGISLISMPVMIANYFGHKLFAPLFGAQAFVATIAIAAGPFLVGLSFDHIGSYALSFTIMAALALAGAVLIVFNRPPRIGTPVLVPCTDVAP